MLIEDRFLLFCSMLIIILISNVLLYALWRKRAEVGTTLVAILTIVSLFITFSSLLAIIIIFTFGVNS